MTSDQSTPSEARKNSAGQAVPSSYFREVNAIGQRYDYLGRRISKTSGGATTCFIHDGWNLIAGYEISNSQFQIRKAYLAVKTGPATCYPICDGNGNASEKSRGPGGVLDRSAATCPAGVSRRAEPANQYLDSNGAVAAHFNRSEAEMDNPQGCPEGGEAVNYDPFGKLVAVTGDQEVEDEQGNVVNHIPSVDFAHRFSPEYLDNESRTCEEWSGAQSDATESNGRARDCFHQIAQMSEDAFREKTRNGVFVIRENDSVQNAHGRFAANEERTGSTVSRAEPLVLLDPVRKAPKRAAAQGGAICNRPSDGHRTWNSWDFPGVFNEVSVRPAIRLSADGKPPLLAARRLSETDPFSNKVWL